MATPQGPTSLTTSGISDGQLADEVDLLVPLGEVEDAIDEARTTLAVSDNDSTLKYLEDAIEAGDGISVATQNEGANETVKVTCTVSAVPTGIMLPTIAGTVPTGFLLCNGQEVSLTTYKDLLDALLDNTSFKLTLDSGIVFTAAFGTDTFSSAAHGLSDDEVVCVSNSGGALPAGLSAETPYYVISATTDTFQLSTTQGGSAVNITDDGTGTHSFHEDYAVPDMRGYGFVGIDNMGGSSANVITASEADKVGDAYGAEDHTLTVSEMPAHTHTHTSESPGGVGYARGSAGGSVQNTSSTGGGGAHNNVQPSFFGNWIVKT